MKNILDKFEINIFTYILFLMSFLCGYFKDVYIIFIIVLFHELGHVLFFILFKIDINKIVIYPFGGFSYVNIKIHEKFFVELLCILGGVINQLLLYLIFRLLYNNGIINYYSYSLFLKYNKSILLFNLLPIIPLDGSKLVLCLFKKVMYFKLCYLIYLIISIISLVIFMFCARNGDLLIVLFLFSRLIDSIKEFRYVINKFYLERVLYDHYYNKIIYSNSIDKMRIDKYYYINYIDEKEYLRVSWF